MMYMHIYVEDEPAVLCLGRVGQAHPGGGAPLHEGGSHVVFISYAETVATMIVHATKKVS